MDANELTRRVENQRASLTALWAENADLRERLDLAIRKLDRITDVVQMARVRCATPIAPPSTKPTLPSMKSETP